MSVTKDGISRPLQPTEIKIPSGATFAVSKGLPVTHDCAGFEALFAETKPPSRMRYSDGEPVEPMLCVGGAWVS